jgi:hypothetical protein
MDENVVTKDQREANMNPDDSVRHFPRTCSTGTDDSSVYTTLITSTADGDHRRTSTAH